VVFVTADKPALRRRLLAERTALGPATRAEASASICTRLEDLPELASRPLLLAYAPFAEEVDVVPFLDAHLAAGGRLVLPRVNGNQLFLIEVSGLDDLVPGWRGCAIGVFGGSGFYSLLENVREIKVDTPYGPPSDSFFLADVAGRRVAFLPRHGRRHTIPPHKVNYRANVWAMRSLGVKAVISPCAAGSLQLHVEPGHFVVSDQFVDRTNGRADTFFDGPIVSHVSSAEIYDPVLRGIALEVIREHGITAHDGGTVVVIQGPRFSTRAESKWFSDAGWEVINMTQYPEAYLCRELGMAVVNIALITDYDAGAP
jgi:5'-methylthioadenosine phosphorylase